LSNLGVEEIFMEIFMEIIPVNISVNISSGIDYRGNIPRGILRII